MERQPSVQVSKIKLSVCNRSRICSVVSASIGKITGAWQCGTDHTEAFQLREAGRKCQGEGKKGLS